MREAILAFLNRPDISKVSIWLLMGSLGVITGTLILVTGFCMFNAFWRESWGHTCLICGKHWIGKGCGCIERKPNKLKRCTNPNFLAMDLDEKLYWRMRNAQRHALESYQSRQKKAMWQVRRDAFFTALMDYRDSRKRGVFR